MILVGKVIGINTSDKNLNIQVEDNSKITYNLKITPEIGTALVINEAYEFQVESEESEGRTHYNITSFRSILDFDLIERDKAMRDFYENSPISLDESRETITNYIKAIDNKIIKDIVDVIVEKYCEELYTYPAATKMHHNYVGGLAYHVIGMLKLADGFLNTYKYLNKDYLYAGIILHDIGKAKELTRPVSPAYSDEGQLIGHLVMGAMEINLAAEKLGYQGSEEAMILEHMLISHHGVPQFGAAKKPLVAEALLLWYIDTIDSKFRVLEEELPKTESGSFTSAIGVIDKTKIYKI